MPQYPPPPPRAAQLTGEHGRHKGGKHEEEHGEEEAAGVVEDLAGIVTNVQVKEADEHADDHVGHKPQVGEDLGEERGWATGQGWADQVGQELRAALTDT